MDFSITHQIERWIYEDFKYSVIRNVFISQDSDKTKKEGFMKMI